MRQNPLHTKKVKINVEYEITTGDEDIDKETILKLLENEPPSHVLTLISSGSGLEWRENLKSKNVEVEDI